MQANAAKKRLMRTAKAYPDEIRAATQAGSELGRNPRIVNAFHLRTLPGSQTAVDSCGCLRIITA
jgi:hypothetical protein